LLTSKSYRHDGAAAFVNHADDQSKGREPMTDQPLSEEPGSGAYRTVIDDGAESSLDRSGGPTASTSRLSA
jgi:hypothetical protein